jgi:hypothetical protein
MLKTRLPMKKIIAFSVVLLSGALAAQAPQTDERVAALKESLAKNQAALRQYTWVETTQISLKGEVKKQEQKQCSYGADGKVVKTPMPNAAPAAAKAPESSGGRGGRLKKAVVENKVDDLKDYMEKVAALVQQYVPPDPQKIQAAQAAGNVSVQPTGNVAALTVKSYLKPDDMLAIGFDTAQKKMASYKVNSYVDDPKDDVVTLAVTFATLADGTAHPQQTVLDATAKKIQVKITNSGYKKAGS